MMGRETALDPMEWTADGWPMVNRLKGPSCLQISPFPASEAKRTQAAEKSTLADGTQEQHTGSMHEALREKEDWIAPRTDPKTFARAEGESFLLRCGADPAGKHPCSLLMCRQQETWFEQCAEADLTECKDGSAAGLAGYYDERSFFLFMARRRGNNIRLEILEQIGEERRTQILREWDGLNIQMRVIGEGLTRRVSVLEAGAWQELMTFRTEYLSDEGLAGGKRFTGALLGMAAVGEGLAAFRRHHVRFEERPDEAVRRTRK